MFLAFFFGSYWISTQPMYIRINHGAMIFMYLRKKACAVTVIHETCCELAMQLRRLSRPLVHAAGDVANASSWGRARRRPGPLRDLLIAPAAAFLLHAVDEVGPGWPRAGVGNRSRVSGASRVMVLVRRGTTPGRRWPERCPVGAAPRSPETAAPSLDRHGFESA